MEEEEECQDLSGTNNTLNFFVGDSEHGMAHIFSFLNFVDLSACRLVSRFWYDVSFPVWLAKAPCKTLTEENQQESSAAAPKVGVLLPCPPAAMSIATFLKRFHDDDDESRDYPEFEGTAIRQFRRFSLVFQSCRRRGNPSSSYPKSTLAKLKLQVQKWRLKLQPSSSSSSGSSDMEAVAHAPEPWSTGYKLLHGFLTSCGSWITELKLHNFIFPPDMKTFENVFYCRQFTPKLKDLRVIDCSYVHLLAPPPPQPSEKEESMSSQHLSGVRSLVVDFGSNIGGGLPVPWTDFLAHYPELKELTVLAECSSPSNENEPWDILNAVSQLRRRKTDKMKLQLSKLDVNMHYYTCNLYESPERLLDFYREAQLPLDQLSVDIMTKKTSTGFVSELVKLHSSSLKELHISNRSASWKHGWSPPVVEGLRKLEICGLPVFKDFGFLRQFPNLESLRVRTSSSNLISSSTDEDIIVMTSLTKVDFGFEEICGPEEIRKIERWMPNLRWLAIAVTEEGGGEEAVHESWPQLEQIYFRQVNPIFD